MSRISFSKAARLWPVPAPFHRLARTLCLVLALLAALAVSTGVARADGDVLDCTEEELRTAVTGGGDVFFVEDCSITLTAPIVIDSDTSIDGSGYNIQLSGGNTNRLFEVQPGVTLTLSGLVLSGGFSPNGGAVYIYPGATVLITNCALVGNVAQGTDGTNGAAGATSDMGSGGNGRKGEAGAPAWGGAIYNMGDLTVADSLLQTNAVIGGNGGAGGEGGGGFINGGNGASGAAGATGFGGAIFNAGTLHLSGCTFDGNTATGGDAGAGGAGGSATFSGLSAGGAAGGMGAGAAVYSLNVISVEGCTFSGNAAHGGNSTSGGEQENGNGTPGFAGATGLGGGLYVQGRGGLTNCTLYGNSVMGGLGGDGGSGQANAGNGGNGGSASGGGLYSTGTVAVVNCTFYFCSAVGGSNGVAGAGSFGGADGRPGSSRGGGVANGGTLVLMNSLFATNAPGTNVINLSGTLTDGGYNLSSDKSSALSAGTSLKNTDPRVFAPAANGGLTMTLALNTNSPALNRIPPSASFPETDQRGVHRPNGVNADIGAFELASAPEILTQPESQWQTNGGTVVFSVEAVGTSLRYQWHTNGVPALGGTGPTYTVRNVSISNASQYQVVITNSFGKVTSDVAFLYLAPLIVSQPTNTAAVAGDPASFSVSVVGTQPLFYQWFHGTNRINGATGTNYTINSASAADEGVYTVVVGNYATNITSAQATFTLLIKPTISAQPLSQAVAPGSNVTFTVRADGTGPLKYQWRFNGVDISSGATAASYSLNARFSDSGNYDVIVFGPGGSIRSDLATLTVLTPVAITSQSATTVTLAHGQTTNLVATATGDSLSFQWQFNGTNLPGATGASLTIANAQAEQMGTYLLVVSNAVSRAQSQPIQVTVLLAPTITQQPVSQAVTVGQSAAMTVGATGTAPLSYQWFKGSTPVVDGGGVTGASSARLAFATAQTDQAGSYTVVVTNAYGSATSTAATLSVSPVPVVAWDPPAQTNQIVAAGTPLTLTVTAYGQEPLTYQWFRNGLLWTNATTNFAVFAGVQADDAGEYTVVVTNLSGSATTAPPALLSLGVEPAVVQGPADQSVLQGSQATFSVTATGSTPLFYKWAKYGSNFLTGWLTTNQFSLTNVQAGDAGPYSVVVSNIYGQVMSPVATLTVLLPPTITRQPTNQMVAPGAAAAFQVTVAGTEPLTYQWRHAGTNLPGANASLLSIAGAQTPDAGDYAVVVSNDFGSVTSAVVSLTLRDAAGPNLAIDTYTNNQPVAARTLLLTGTASDVGRGGSAIVSVTVNGLRATNDTASGQGEAHWSFGAKLASGTNTFTVMATDEAHNATTVMLRLFLDTNRPTLAITAPTKNLQWTNVAYKVLGTAQDNYRLAAVFYQLNTNAWVQAQGTSNWTAQIQLLPGTNTLRAYAIDLAGNRSTTNSSTFKYNQFLTLKGSYNGLFVPAEADPAASNSGFVSLTVTDQGKFTGRLMQEGKTYTLSGGFNAQRQAAFALKRTGKAPLGLTLAVDAEHLGQNNVVSGSITCSNLWHSDLLAYRTDTSRANARAGSYTLLIGGSDDWGASFGDEVDAPAGDSPATVKLSSLGAITLTGSLANGATLSQSTAVSELGYWPLYVSLNTGRGLLVGWLAFDTNQPASVFWCQPPGVTGSFYTNGFGQYRSAWLQPWSQAVRWTNATVVVTGGNLPVGQGLTNRVTYSNNVFRVLSGGSISNLTLSATATTGVFKGKFVNPLSRKSSAINGVLEARPDAANDPVSGGFWLGPKGESGNVRIIPE